MATKHAAPPKSAPRRRRTSTRASAAGAVSAPLYSADEKRNLILAHAAMRRPQDPVQLMSAWSGVVVAMMVVAVGWWWLSGSVVIQNFGKVGTETKDALADAPPVFQQDFGTLMKQTVDKLRVMEVQASDRERTLDVMASLVASSTESAREDLFQPTVTSSQSVTSTTQAQTTTH